MHVLTAKGLDANVQGVRRLCKQMRRGSVCRPYPSSQRCTATAQQQHARSAWWQRLHCFPRKTSGGSRAIGAVEAAELRCRSRHCSCTLLLNGLPAAAAVAGRHARGWWQGCGLRGGGGGYSRCGAGVAAAALASVSSTHAVHEFLPLLRHFAPVQKLLLRAKPAT